MERELREREEREGREMRDKERRGGRGCPGLLKLKDGNPTGNSYFTHLLPPIFRPYFYLACLFFCDRCDH